MARVSVAESESLKSGAIKPRVLIVDDEPQIVHVLAKALTMQGFEVISATDGLQGLQMARDQQPSLIVLDLHLPRLDGHAICKMLKSDQRSSSIPVVMLTASVEIEDREWASKTGADAFVSKPFELTEVVATVNALLAAKRASPSVS